MYYFELTCTAYIKQAIDFKKSFETISKYISYALAQSDHFRTLHEENRFKYYVFGSFLPIEKERLYKTGESYTFALRTLDEKLCDELQRLLRENINNPFFQVLSTQKRAIKQYFINELYTATPTIMTNREGLFWTMQKDGDITALQKQLQDNLEKKYASFYGEKLEPIQNFIQLLEIKNRVPQNIEITKNGKRVRFFGNKFRIVPHEDEVSQKLAFLALGAGLGEKNSFGGGFCVSHSVNSQNRGVER